MVADYASLFTGCQALIVKSQRAGNNKPEPTPAFATHSLTLDTVWRNLPHMSSSAPEAWRIEFYGPAGRCKRHATSHHEAMIIADALARVGMQKISVEQL